MQAMASAPAVLSVLSFCTLLLVAYTFFFSSPSNPSGSSLDVVPLIAAKNDALESRYLEQLTHQRREMDLLTNTLSNLGKNDGTFTSMLEESRKELEVLHRTSEEHMAAHATLLKQIYDRVESLQKDILDLSKHQEDDRCVVNPSQHFEDTGYLEKECPSHGVKGVGNQVVDPATAILRKSYMLNLPGHFEDYAVRRDYMKKRGVDLQRFEAIEGKKVFADLYEEYYDAVTNTSTFTFTDVKTGKVLKRGDEGYLTFGERGYLASMKAIFEMSLKDPSVETVMVMDDDAIIDCNFHETLNRVLKEPRCGDQVARDSKHGGVLLLGAAVWINGTWPERTKWTGGWNQITNDMLRASEALGKPTQCFNADGKTMGSFGVIYHRDVFQIMVDWIATTSEPFDHIYPFLSRQGHAVRVAYPSIVIQDVRHTSSVDPSRKGQEDASARAKMHRWDLSKFCSPEDGKPMA